MRRDEVFSDGVLIAADVWDLAAGTYSREENGTVVSTRPLTPEEVVALTPVPTAEERRAQLRAAILAAETQAEMQALMLELLELGA